MPCILGILLATVAVALMTSCTSSQPDDPNNVSNIPWNPPEKWEGQRPMGSMAPGSR